MGRDTSYRHVVGGLGSCVPVGALRLHQGAGCCRRQYCIRSKIVAKENRALLLGHAVPRKPHLGHARPRPSVMGAICAGDSVTKSCSTCLVRCVRGDRRRRPREWPDSDEAVRAATCSSEKRSGATGSLANEISGLTWMPRCATALPLASTTRRVAVRPFWTNGAKSPRVVAPRRQRSGADRRHARRMFEPGAEPDTSCMRPLGSSHGCHPADHTAPRRL